ncbi:MULTISPECIES: ribosome maturation factor RimP [Okeania]|uniref:Ribosome maturation factor RimP n=1 Tax=Okeania hirsuta TaxID=1458930 RepID=A0A3N6NSB5_9CYAN|nr:MULTISPECIES: ribosome maturation factor RimP [Okeania]NEP06172.1 ribosome maturation factor RimP [Okeania sp. SIO4D6]NEP39803.1 ribosome maturation factor RimP [Okeania sp. SIO2H7]NET12304.1 ribosome maturation factor RimP [Okeania sp. SIO1H6]NEP72403.1 ribosome maturation factor RimP [Okeania sp. SIO2G5]NEP87732.1 ribosome maturation factor RimP [Okeania sp. SIO2C2]
MSHPLIPQIINFATPIAESLGLELVGAVFHTNQHPPVLRLDIRNFHQDTGLDDCERMSYAIEESLDAANIISEPYLLEISSPGISKFLDNDRDFIAFKGFSVTVNTSEPYKGKNQWIGQLVGRDQTAIYINQKGRQVTIPRSLIMTVELQEGR